MKEGWEYKKIKDIGSVIGGTTPNTNIAEYWDGNLCWISPAELDGSHYLYDSRKKITEAAVKAKSLRLLPEGTVILSSRAPIGKVVINKVPTYCNQGFKCVVCDKEIYNEFLYWWFWGKTEYLNSLGTGATFKEISKKVVEEITIPVPPLPEQQSIVDYLDSAFAKIDAMKANAEKALNEAKALFQASLKEMLEPKEGWEEKTIEHYAKIIHGKNQKDVLDDNGLYPIYGSGGNIMGYANSYLCEEGTTILGRKGTIDNPLFIDEKFWNVDTAFGIIAKNNCNKKFLYYAIKKVDWAKLNTGTTLPSLTQNVVYNVEMCAPSLSEQQSIVATIDSLKSKVDKLQANYDKISQECDALKQAILRQVFE